MYAVNVPLFHNIFALPPGCPASHCTYLVNSTHHQPPPTALINSTAFRHASRKGHLLGAGALLHLHGSLRLGVLRIHRRALLGRHAELLEHSHRTHRRDGGDRGRGQHRGQALGGYLIVHCVLEAIIHAVVGPPLLDASVRGDVRPRRVSVSLQRGLVAAQAQQLGRELVPLRLELQFDRMGVLVHLPVGPKGLLHSLVDGDVVALPLAEPLSCVDLSHLLNLLLLLLPSLLELGAFLLCIQGLHDVFKRSDHHFAFRLRLRLRQMDGQYEAF
mmetsp:Transcript_18180/g.40350  ORF Transcript_18180/g.40350 Transcript_18180/m.40350 type:complete len:273 (+) Transcript_18180:2849-3667(+)